jgi:hypothetical protein
MEGLVARMTQVDPATRPPIEVVLEEFTHIRGSLSREKLCSVVTYKKESEVLGIFRKAMQYIRAMWTVVLRRPPIPDRYS